MRAIVACTVWLLIQTVNASEKNEGSYSVQECLEACTYLETLSKDYLTYSAKGDLFPILKSPLCVDWLREARDIKTFRRLSSTQIWKSRDGNFSSKASFVNAAGQDGVVLRTSAGNEINVEIRRLDSASDQSARFLIRFSKHIVELGNRTRARAEEHHRQSTKRTAADRCVIGFIDSAYLSSIGMDKSAAVAEGLQNVLLPQLSEAEQRGLWNDAVLYFYGSSPQRQAAIESVLMRESPEKVNEEKEVRRLLMSLSDRERLKANLERMNKGLGQLEEFSFADIDATISDGLQKLFDAANAALEDMPSYRENIYSMSRDELRAADAAQQKAMNGREVVSLRSNLDAYWQGAPERRRFFKEYCNQLKETAGNEEIYQTWLEGIHVYYCAQLLEFRRLHGLTDIKNNRVDHQRFIGFLSLFSYAPLALQ